MREREHSRELEREWPGLLRDRLPEAARSREEDAAAERIPKPRTKLTKTQVDVLADAGRFRLVRVDDLAEVRYRSDHKAMLEDIRSLEKKGLLAGEQGSARTGTVLTLTDEGAHRMRSLFYGSGQKFYAGEGRQRDIDHDSHLYRMYHLDAEKLRDQGMKLQRVELEQELKSKFWRDVDEEKTGWRYRLSKDGEREARYAVAARHDLRVIDGRVVFPDVRVLYETPEREPGRCDIELTTQHYRAGQIAVKRAAGMNVYGIKTHTWGRHNEPGERLFEL